MKKLYVLAAAAASALALAAAPAAYAKDNDGGCRGNCPTETGGGDVTANPSANAGAIAAAGAVAVGVGGQGGEGGRGGAGGQGGIGLGGAGGSASLGNLNRFGGDATAISGPSLSGAYAGGSSSGASATGGQVGDTTATAAGGQGGHVGDIAPSQSVNIEGDKTVYEAQKRAPVNTAYAAPISIGSGVCAYAPVSAGLSLIGGSGSVSGAKIDQGCERRANADVMARFGDINAARRLLMLNPDVAKAYSDAGYGGGVAAVDPVGEKLAVQGEAPKAFSFTPMQPIPN